MKAKSIYFSLLIFIFDPWTMITGPFQTLVQEIFNCSRSWCVMIYKQFPTCSSLTVSDRCFTSVWSEIFLCPSVGEETESESED